MRALWPVPCSLPGRSVFAQHPAALGSPTGKRPTPGWRLALCTFLWLRCNRCPPANTSAPCAVHLARLLEDPPSSCCHGPLHATATRDVFTLETSRTKGGCMWYTFWEIKRVPHIVVLRERNKILQPVSCNKIGGS